MLKISDNLSLPVETVTQTIAILAKRRAGKSYTMRRLVEQLFSAGQQVVIVDPKGDQWGIRSTADGKGPGLPIIILGGERGDVPLESSGGEIVAKLVVEEQVSILLDVSLFRKHEVATFMTSFLENLYRLKAREIYRTPMMLVIDEADAVAPQKPQKGEERMLGAAEDIVRRGGQRGIGCVLVTQRSAVLNKNVLTQAQMLVALRTIAPQDLAAMDAWIQVHGEPDQRKTLMESLPSLPVGDAWFWSPGWPGEHGIFKRVHVSPIVTFDSGATPKPGEKRIQPKNLADVDLEALTRQMAATIEKAKADDPKELRKKIAALERQLKQPAAKPAAPAKAKRVEVPVLKDSQIKSLETILDRIVKENERHDKAMALFSESLGKIGGEISQALRAVRNAPPVAVPQPQSVSQRPFLAQKTPAVARPHANGGDASPLPIGEEKVLTAAIQHRSVSRPQLTVLIGYKRSSRDTYIQRLREKGYVEVSGDRIQPTLEGKKALGDCEPLPTGADLRAYWLNRLPQGEQKVLLVALDAYPESVAREQIDEITGYKRSSRDTYIQRLSAKELLDVAGRGEVKASGVLFA